jgi:hypothetical protein
MIAKFITHLNKAERGQSIIILAFAFVVLLGFVGLTTDVSLMFVRYATIRRAVDSASLAAASQMRQGTEEASVLIAAKQFVQFHGLDAVDVLVETCQTLDRAAPAPDPSDDDYATKLEEYNELQAKIAELCTADQRKLVKVTVQAQSPTAFLKLLGWDSFTLQASAVSETAALDVVLIMDVSESMLTDTNYDDWAKIQMGYAFKPPNIRYDVAGAKGYDTSNTGDWDEYWANEVAGQPQSVVNSRLFYTGAASTTSGSADADYNVEWVDLGESPAANKYAEEYGFPPDVSTIIPRGDCRVRLRPFSKNSSLSAFPARANRSGGSNDDSFDRDVLALHETETGYGGGLYGEKDIAWIHDDLFNGFMPTYNYYGCCNDPGTALESTVVVGTTNQAQKDGDGNIIMASSAADFNFEDLICQPFKGARDAVELFLEKIDFIRGDRVAFVTFDRTAYLVNPWNQTGQAVGGSHMIDRYDYALETLRRVIGVRAEPNFYVWDDQLELDDPEPNARWGALAAGITRNADDIASSQGINYNNDVGAGYLHGHAGDPDFFFSADNEINYYYPVVGNCEFDNASLDTPYSLFDGSLGQVSLPYPQNKSQTGVDLIGGNKWDEYEIFNHPTVGDIKYNNPAIKDGLIARFSYDYWASCRGTNIGAALREANNALLDPNTSRRFGAIWVMVLLSDGAAGASDPVRRTDPLATDFDPDKGGRKLNTTKPYIRNDATNELAPEAGEYGAFGVCPYGAIIDPGPVVDTYTTGLTFPYCSDDIPETRTLCDFRPADGVEAMQDADYEESPLNASGTTIESSAEILQWNQDRGNLYDVDIGTTEDCTYYDVDDYARDWADFIGLRDEESATEELLPTIYTIGFGLTFGGDGEAAIATDHVSDYLGEQMLRYIADVGDNNQLDNDYYQNFADDEPYIGSVDEFTVDGGYGVRGPCQEQDEGYTNVGDSANGYDFNGNGVWDNGEADLLYDPVEPTQDCGNYFNAPNADQLEFVFDSIASKLFTRLTG